MKFPQTSELYEFNRVLIAVAELSPVGKSCSAEAVDRLCSSVVFRGKPADYYRVLRLCSHAGLLEYRKGEVRLTEDGLHFLGINPESQYELTEAQKVFVAERLILNGVWKSSARDLFLNFSPNYSKVTYELNLLDNILPVRYNLIVHVLQILGVIERLNGILSVTPRNVALVRALLTDKPGFTEEQLDGALAANRKLGAQAEEVIVEYERFRLQELGRPIEAGSVSRISQLDVSAGYDIKSFDGVASPDAPPVYDRFIEVKASATSELRFFWSANEYKVAQSLGERYWIYLLSDFRRTSAAIVPIMIQDPATRLFQVPGIDISTANYVITMDKSVILQPTSYGSVRAYKL